MNLEHINVEAVAKAVEADAGRALPGLRQSLEQAKRGEFAAIHTPQAIAARRAGRPKAAVTKEAVKIRLDPDVLAVLRATGKG
ncbi:XRE family transcriptional regulator [Allofranklinella schreckenbergeri]|uniref:XRE family transcriptional regulator n=1 Tax=Allofranklinella schreckenbergeri TaxID=1076744 RepID=A0A3M6QBS2_9BURK|nr:BrnA antitoxin family protein [Allofranklinella schreckenbergeri]RMX00500.1 XRE family transcriptional regulator [Allofranklinella schreckenbergeri]